MPLAVRPFGVGTGIGSGFQHVTPGSSISTADPDADNDRDPEKYYSSLHFATLCGTGQSRAF